MSRRVYIQFQSGDTDPVRLEKLRRLADDVANVANAIASGGLAQADADLLYAALVHTHEIADVDGLQAILDGLTAGSGTVDAVIAGTGIDVDPTDPTMPIVSLNGASIASLALADTAVQPARTLTAGAGLTGGGDLSADRTFNVGAGTGITVNADDIQISAAYLGANPTAQIGLVTINGVATSYMRSDAAPSLDQSIVPTWTGQHTFTAALNIFLQNAGPLARFEETDQATNEKRGALFYQGRVFGLRIESDDSSVTSNGLRLIRSANVLTQVTLGNTTDLPVIAAIGRLETQGTLSLGTRQSQTLADGANNDLALTNDTTRTYFAFSPGAGSIITGFAAPSPTYSRVIAIQINSGNAPVYVSTLDSRSSSGNQITVDGNFGVSRLYLFRPAQVYWFLYDTNANNWRNIGGAPESVEDTRLYNDQLAACRRATWFNSAWIEEGLPFTEVGTMTAQAAAGGSGRAAATPRRRATSAGAINSACEIYGANVDSGVLFSNSGTAQGAGFQFIFVISPQAVHATERVFYGLTSSNAAIAAGADPPTTNMVGFAKNTADTNLQFVRNDGAGGRNVTDLGITHESLVGDFVVCKIWTIGGAGRILWQLLNLTDGTSFHGQSTTQLPAADTLLYPHFWNDTGPSDGTAVALELMRVTLQPSP